MRLAVAHHFWQNRETATWVPAGPPWPEVEALVKARYLELELARPPWLTLGRVTVFLAYKPDSDIFGRSITPISFGLLADCREPEKTSAVVLPLLAATPPERTVLEASLPWEEGPRLKLTPPGPRSSRFLSWPILAVLAASGAALLLIAGQLKPGPAGPPPAAPVSVVRDPLPPVSAEAEPEAASAAGPALCAADGLRGGLFGCPRAFAEQKCGRPNSIPGFADWLKSAAGARACTFGVDWSRNSYHREEDRLSPEDRQQVRSFFERSE